MRRTLLLSLAVLAIAPRASHAAPCDTLGLPGTVYLQVGDTQLNLMKQLARKLRDNTARPITLVFTTSGSCTNINAIYNRVPFAATTNLQYVPSTAEDPAWTPASPTLTCTPPAGKVPDVANSALFNSACTPDPPPATVHLAQGPTQAYVMAVPAASSQTAITFEEAYFVFGFGTAGMVAPWTVEANLFIRTVTKSTLLAWAANIGVPPAKWKGTQFDGSAMVVSALEGAGAAAESSIGILGAEVYDAKRATLKSLAFRAKGQYAAYYPDSTSSKIDKQNVRDGHYTVWSPTIWMDTVTGTTPVNADARYVIDLIVGNSVTPAASFSPVSVIAAVGLVPQCAMGVTRSFEGGPLSLYTPPESCVCKYESLVTPASSCATCSATTPCASGVCRDGFCEAN